MRDRQKRKHALTIMLGNVPREVVKQCASESKLGLGYKGV